MSRSRSKRQVVILDSCFSGAFAEGLSAKDDGTVNIREQLGGEGRAVLTSSSSTQYSFEQEGSDLSIYTHYLIEGITTGAADRDDDGFVSIGELHEYASGKVREIQPTMKPEIHPGKEGYTIRLAKVPPGDPKQKYGKEVARYIKRGEISFVGRETLNVLRTRLGLSLVEVTAIEDDILAVARQEFREKLLQYEQAFTNAFQQQVAPSEEDVNELRQNLQQILGLRNEDTMPIEARVKTTIEAYKQKLQSYEQELAGAMQREYPLSKAAQERLQKMQEVWKLTNKDIASLEKRVTAEREIYRQKLQQYEQVFTRATQQQYPLTEAKRHELRQEQQNLSLKDEDINPIETRITSEIAAHIQKLQQYEQVLIQTIQQQYPFNKEIREELKRYQQVLELGDDEVAQIQEKVVGQIEPKLIQSNQLITLQPLGATLTPEPSSSLKTPTQEEVVTPLWQQDASSKTQWSSNSQTAVNNQKISVPTASINFRPLMVVGGIILAVSLTVGIYSSLQIPPPTENPQNTENNSSQTASASTNSPSTTNSTRVCFH